MTVQDLIDLLNEIPSSQRMLSVSMKVKGKMRIRDIKLGDARVREEINAVPTIKLELVRND